MSESETEDLFRDNARPLRKLPLFEAALSDDEKSARGTAVGALLFATALFGLAGYIVWYSMGRGGDPRVDEVAPILSASLLGLAMTVWAVRVLRGASKWKPRYRSVVRQSDPSLVWLYRGHHKGYPSGAVHFAFDDGKNLILMTAGPSAATALIDELAHEGAHFAIGVGNSAEKRMDYKKRFR